MAQLHFRPAAGVAVVASAAVATQSRFVDPPQASTTRTHCDQLNTSTQTMTDGLTEIDV